MSVFNNKEKLEYFKNNVQASEEQGDFDPSQYYYNRENGLQNDNLSQQQSNGYTDSYGGQNTTQLQRQQMQQQQALRNGTRTTGSTINGQQGGIGTISNSSPSSGLYNGSSLVGNRSIGDFSNSIPSNSNLGTTSRVISNSNLSSGGFDSTNFPSLTPSGSSNLLSGSSPRGYSAVAASTPLGSLRDQDFNVASEDFPALPGSGGGGGSGLMNRGGDQQIVGHTLSGENRLGVPGGGNSSANNSNSSQVLNQGANTMFSGSVLSDSTTESIHQHGNQSFLSGIGGGGHAQQAVTKEQRFGLMGLLDVIRYTDKDINTLALGTDLTTFGLNLNSSDSLFPSFGSPFTDTAQVPEPQFTTPACYMMHPPSPKSEHLSKFQIETLFYMFYAMPKDILQACASQELYRREWRYHTELRVWLKARAPQELMQSHPNVQFVFFDSSAWETRLFTTPHRGNITAGLLSEEEVRVKAPQTNNSIPLGGTQ